MGSLGGENDLVNEQIESLTDGFEGGFDGFKGVIAVNQEDNPLCEICIYKHGTVIILVWI